MISSVFIDRPLLAIVITLGGLLQAISASPITAHLSAGPVAISAQSYLPVASQASEQDRQKHPQAWERRRLPPMLLSPVAWPFGQRATRWDGDMGSMTPQQENNKKLIRQPYHLAEASSKDTAKFMSLFSIITNLLHFGVTIVGLDYGYTGQMMTSEVTGGSPYGATTIAGGDGSRMPSENELAGARFQGRRIAEVAAKLRG
jgi:hypothetical protein